MSLAEGMQHTGFQPCLVVVPGDRQRWFRPVPKFAQSAPRYAVCYEDAQGGGLSDERWQVREGIRFRAAEQFAQEKPSAAIATPLAPAGSPPATTVRSCAAGAIAPSTRSP